MWNLWKSLEMVENRRKLKNSRIERSPSCRRTKSSFHSIKVKLCKWHFRNYKIYHKWVCFFFLPFTTTTIFGYPFLDFPLGSFGYPSKCTVFPSNLPLVTWFSVNFLYFPHFFFNIFWDFFQYFFLTEKRRNTFRNGRYRVWKQTGKMIHRKGRRWRKKARWSFPWKGCLD